MNYIVVIYVSGVPQRAVVNVVSPTARPLFMRAPFPSAAPAICTIFIAHNPRGLSRAWMRNVNVSWRCCEFFGESLCELCP